MLPEDFRDARRYGRTPDGRLVELVHRHGRRAPAAVPGAIALFRWPPRETPGHMGIVSRGGYLIHADARLGRVVEVGLRGQWARTLDSLWYVPGVEYGAAGEAAA